MRVGIEKTHVQRIAFTRTIKVVIRTPNEILSLIPMNSFVYKLSVLCLSSFLLLGNGCRQLSSHSISDEETVFPVWDGLRLLSKSGSSCEGNPEEAIRRISYHYKKNPGRYSGLDVKERWRNVQLTVLKDKENLLNDSRDSLLLFKGGACSILSDFTVAGSKISSGSKPTFEFSLVPFSTQGEKVQSSGELEIRLGDIPIFKKEISGRGESWEDVSFALQENVIELLSGENPPSWKFEWKPKNAGDLLFIGEPILFASVQEPKEWGRKENVILFVVDALRPDRLGFGGSPVQTSPNLDKLAEESIVFENAFANGNWTKPSMLSFFTSRIASELGMGNAWFYSTNLHRKIFYSKKPDTIANHLRAKGYLTASLMNNVFLLDYTGVGVDLGFHKLFQPGKDKADTELILDESLKFLRKNKNRRFFLHININTPHYPYLPERKYTEALEKSTPPAVWNEYDPYVKKYLAEILYTDEVIGKILDEAKKTGAYENSWVVLVADHGELQELEHYYHHHFVAQNLHAHGESHYEEEIKVPWILHPPASVKSSVQKWKFSDQVSLLSLFPTLAGALGFPCEPESCVGNDYSLPIFGGQGPTGEETVYTEGRFSESVRTKEFKLIRRYPGYDFVRRTYEGQPHKMTEELYDLAKDPKESKNLASPDSGLPLLVKARKTLEENSLKKNSFRLRLPACSDACTRKVDLHLQGGIYRIFSEEEISFHSLEAKNASFSVRQNPGKEVIVTAQSVEPIFGFRLSIEKNGKSEDFKSGRWGILSRAANSMYVSYPELVSSSKQPFEFRTSSLPYWYNDAGLSGNSESSQEAALGKEVRKVLESWGYIHE